MKKAWILLVLLLFACEAIPDEEERIEIPHKISLDVMKITKDPLYPSSILSYNYTILNTGKEDLFDIALESRIIRKSTGEVIATEAEIVPMALVVFKERGIPIPADVKKGEYELIVVGTFDDGKDTDSIKFTVDREEEPEEKKEEEEETKEEFTIVLEEPEEEKEEEEQELSNERVEVLIHDYAYVPAEIEIKVGTTVVWYNNDSVPHTVTGAGFDSGPLPTGETFEERFTKPIIKIYSSSTTEGPYGRITITE